MKAGRTAGSATKAAAIFFAAGLAAAQPQPRDVALLPPDSIVSIRTYGMGLIPLDGEFTRFHGWLRYNPADRHSCTVHLQIEVASLSMGDTAMRDRIAGPEFLDAARYPWMEFQGECAKDTVHGPLSLHGEVHEFALELTWEDRKVRAVGRLRRAEWGMTNLPVLGGSTVRIVVSARVASLQSLVCSGPAGQVFQTSQTTGNGAFTTPDTLLRQA